MNRWVGILACSLPAGPMLAAGIQALVIPWTAEPDDTGSGQTVDLDGLIEAAIASAAGRRAQRDLARAATRLSLTAVGGCLQ